MKESEEYMIKMADKAQEDISNQEELKSRHLVRREFWKQYLDYINQKCGIYSNVSPSKDSWITGATGVSGVQLNSVASNYYGPAEIYITRSSKSENKMVFDELFNQKKDIESVFGSGLTWERLDSKKACRIKFELSDVDIYHRDDWSKMIEFMADAAIRLEKAFKQPLSRIKAQLKERRETQPSN
jgi:hypothetical protein